MAALAAEDEDVAAERIGADDLLCLRRQAVEAGAQIDRLASEKDLRSRRQGNHPHPRNAARTRRSAFSLTLLSTRTRAPSGRSISITPTRSAKARPAPRGHTAPPPLALSNSHPMHRRRHRAEQIPPAARPGLAPPARRPSMPIANCTAGWSKPRAGEQPPKPGRPRPLPRLTAPPFAPGSTADDAQRQ